MRLNFTNHYSVCGKHGFRIRNINVRKLVKTTLFLSILIVTLLKANADWWTDSQNGY